MKVDIKRDDTISTQIEYQIFNPINLQQLNLSYCDNSKIIVYPPINLNKKTYNLAKHLKDQGYNLFNSNDYFYNDICSPFNSFNDTDVLLKDRKNDFYIQNITLCEENCEYEDFNLESLKAKCRCDVKVEVNSDKTKVKFYPNRLADNFYKIEKYANIKVFICYDLVFDIQRLKRNYGSYMIICISLLFIILMIINFFTINIKIRRIIQLFISQFNSMIKKLNLKEKEIEKLKKKKHNQKILKTEKARYPKKIKAKNILMLNKSNINFNFSSLKLKNKNTKNMGKYLDEQISNPIKKKKRKQLYLKRMKIYLLIEIF
jgi:hypothetical protein